MTRSPNVPTNPTPTPTPDTPPTSTITSPKEGAIVPIGVQVTITGTASDAGGGSVVRVEVSVDGGANYSAATGTNAWSFNWMPNSPGPVTIKSRAVDNTGNVQNPPAEIHVTVDAPPTSTITSPKEGDTVLIGNPVAITGTASDAGGGTVAKVEVSVDGGLNYSPATGTNAWSFNWTPGAIGQATIKSRAVDNTGNVQNPPAEIHVKVDAVTSTITSPTEGATVLIGKPVAITGMAVASNGKSVVRVDVSLDGGATYGAAAGTNAWNFSWTPDALGPVTIKSRALDNAGNVQNLPAEIHVTVDALPTSTITSPTEGAFVLLGNPVTITGTASDAGDGSVVRVDVSLDGGGAYSAATGTNSWSFNWTPSALGQVTIKSRAVDNIGNQQDPPAAITVTVKVPITIRVPSDQPTIQSAINVATLGDTVLVAPGTYRENIDFGGKAITVTSESGPQGTIIDGRSANPVVIFTSGEGRDSVLNGFTLQNGRADLDHQAFGQGGGIRADLSSPTITNNVITNNKACDGGGIFIGSGSPLIQLNTITSNSAGTNACSGGTVGGGIDVLGNGSAEILDNVISENAAAFGGGIGLNVAGTPIIERNIIKGNFADQGGGIWSVNNSSPLIVQNLITGNQADEGGGVYWSVPADVRGPILVNNTIADNNATSNGSGIFTFGYSAQTELTNNIIVAKPRQSGLYFLIFSDQEPPIIRFNNIFSVDGMAYAGAIPDMTGKNDNISLDPLFANPTQGDYHLQQGSPSIDTGYNPAPNLPDKDVDGQPRILDGDDNGTAIVDMGVDEFRRPIRVPSDQPTIQAAINVATLGDTVLVAPGTYREHIDFRGKAITVTSESGPQVTIIDAGNTDPVVSFTSGEGRKSILNGFTLQNGRTNFGGQGAPPDGGGIVIQRASPTITNNVITNNHASRGSGIGIVFGSPLIQLNTITGNINDVTIGGGGGGILIAGEGFAEILDNVISNNLNNGGGGGIYIPGAGATPIIKRNVIKGNSVALGAFGGGIYSVNNSSPLIVQNLITGNQASNGGGVYWLVPDGVRGPILVNNTIAGNDGATNGSGIYADGGDGRVELTNNIIVAKPGQSGFYCGLFTGNITPIIRFNNIFSSSGMAYGGRCADRTGMDGNISLDPLFANPTQGDYHLQQGSPSIDSGDNLTPYLPDKDLDGHPRIQDGDGNGTAIVDMGVYESTFHDGTPPTSTITSPTAGATVLTGTTVVIIGIASDAGGGTVARVQVSVDGGSTWNVATGTNAWSYIWRPILSGPATIKSRAVDNSGNVQDPPAQITVTVQDATPPTSTITSPTAGAAVLTGTTVIITGIASDAGGGTLARVEVSVDDGSTWNVATGMTAWSYNWTPTTPGPAPIRSRAVDDSGNVQDPPAEITVTVRLPIRVPSDQPTIQAAIDAANNGDAVLVAPGTYVENINFGGKAITVTSESGHEATIIDGGAADSVVRFTSGEGRDSILNGFTLQNGRADPIRGLGDGGGIIVGGGSSPTITNDVVSNNHASSGGGIAILSGSPLIRLNTISGNSNNLSSGGTAGGGIYIQGPGSAEILDNVISDNVSHFGAGIGLFSAGTPIFKRNIIKGNNASQGGGLWIVNDSDPLIVQNIITGNQASDGGGVYWLGSRGPIFINNTIADNNATSNGSGIFAEGSSGRTQLTNNIIVAKPGQAAFYCGNLSGQNQAIIRFNNIFSDGGMAYGGTCSDKTGMDGNIKADPQFTNPTQGDFHLQQGSPSIDAGDNQAPNLPDTDIDGDARILDGDGNGTAIVDMGVDEFLLPPGLKISLLDESDRNSNNSRALFICDLRPWTKTPGSRPKKPISARPTHSTGLRVE
jgi:hypothetical protein